MTIEAQLNELIEINKAMLVAIQSGAQITATAVLNADAAAPAAKRTRRTKAEMEADAAAAAVAADAAAAPQVVDGDAAAAAPQVVDGDPVGTRYWVNQVARAVYAELPGQPTPDAADFKIESPAFYLEKKAEYAADAAKNAQVVNSATTQQATANTEPSAPAAQVTASVATSGAEPTWDDVMKALMAVSQKPEHGSTAVLNIITPLGAKRVSDLKDKGHNAQLLAAANALLNPVEAFDPLS